MYDELVPIADRLRQYIRMLSSDADGEVIAAARALNRTLKNHNFDIHALAESICAPNDKKFSEDEANEIYFRGVEDGRRQAQKERKFQDVTEHDDLSWHDIAGECARHLDRLRNNTEREFIQDMVRRTVRGGCLSEKQQNWLRNCFVRVCR